MKVNTERLPHWFVKPIPRGLIFKQVKEVVSDFGLNTVCVAANCPNLGECFSRGTVTLMILGDICTRNCRFCSVRQGIPSTPLQDEPERVASAVKKLKLSYVVITSVTRDDLPDGGASQFTLTVEAIKKKSSETVVEILTPDFEGKDSSVSQVLKAKPDVFGHNIETVSRLYPLVRPQANYKTSLNILRQAKEKTPLIKLKSGLMLGLGEGEDEVIQTMKDLRAAGCEILTIGQYLKPSKKCLPVRRYVLPHEFDKLRKIAEEMRFFSVAAEPLARSSYYAEKLYFKKGFNN